MCHRENLYQVDLLSPSKNKITQKEYWAARRGQEKLNKRNAQIHYADQYLADKPVFAKCSKADHRSILSFDRPIDDLLNSFNKNTFFRFRNPHSCHCLLCRPA